MITEIRISDEADEVIKKLSDSLKNKYQNNWDYVQLLHYTCHKINLNRGGSYIDSPDWIIKKINPINKKDVFNTL